MTKEEKISELQQQLGVLMNDLANVGHDWREEDRLLDRVEEVEDEIYWLKEQE